MLFSLLSLVKLVFFIVKTIHKRAYLSYFNSLNVIDGDSIPKVCYF